MSSHIEKHFIKSLPSGSFAQTSQSDWTDWQWQQKSNDIIKGTAYYQNKTGTLSSEIIQGMDISLKDETDLLVLSDELLLTKIDADNNSRPVINFSLPRLTQLPQRITKGLVKELESRNQIVIHLFINHPLECSHELFQACSMLADAGIILNNHMTFLKGVNDTPEIVKELNLKLIMMRIRPYSIYLKEFLAQKNEIMNVSKEQAIVVMESLRGWTSGLAVPHLLVESQEGVFEPTLPNYIRQNDGEHFVFRNYKNLDFDYINK